ncbi:hypothetical protein GCM10022243_31180 [Saccharothrix violaceirubra]
MCSSNGSTGRPAASKWPSCPGNRRTSVGRLIKVPDGTPVTVRVLGDEVDFGGTLRVPTAAIVGDLPDPSVVRSPRLDDTGPVIVAPDAWHAAFYPDAIPTPVDDPLTGGLALLDRERPAAGADVRRVVSQVAPVRESYGTVSAFRGLVLCRPGTPEEIARTLCVGAARTRFDTITDLFAIPDAYGDLFVAINELHLTGGNRAEATRSLDVLRHDTTTAHADRLLAGLADALANR